MSGVGLDDSSFVSVCVCTCGGVSGCHLGLEMGIKGFLKTMKNAIHPLGRDLVGGRTARA